MEIFGSKENSSHNYTYHECKHESKKLNNLFGLTYSKEITIDKDDNEFNKYVDIIYETRANCC